MYRFARPGLWAALVAGMAGPAFAADFAEPPIVEAPPPPVYEEVDYGGWYIRGDIDYHWSNFGGADYITYGNVVPAPGKGSFDTGDLKGAFSMGAGVGYQVNQYFRTDLTLDYWFKSDFTGSTSGVCGGVACVSTDSSAYSAWLLLANAYVDLGTYYGITPYLGAGIGGARVKWDDLRNTIDGTTDVHAGAQSWRFAYALMAGASYCLTDNLKLDAGYRFSHINGGRMFEYATPTLGGIGAGPGYDKGFDTHEVRAGLRYQFGGRSDCSVPEPYVPPEPIYTK